MIEAVALDDVAGELILLDQTLLPGEVRFLRLKEPEAIWEAIRSLRVRGAPAIGIAAAYGVYLAARNADARSYEELADKFRTVKQYLATARPTAVNLFWALERMERRLDASKGLAADDAKQALREEAAAIRQEDEAVNQAIGQHGLGLLKPGWGLLTHCNAGAIATSRYGTALAPIYLGQEQGYGFRVYADETRPLLQGARLTAWELHEAGVDVTLICDNMASIVMQQGHIQAVLVGCDRVAANGDTANKIGTSGVAVLARHYGIPFYVCSPTSTLDLNCRDGRDIEIEERAPEEVTETWYKGRMAPAGVKVYNPSFDVTDHSLITGIVTEHGVAYPPFGESLGRIAAASARREAPGSGLK